MKFFIPKGQPDRSKFASIPHRCCVKNTSSSALLVLLMVVLCACQTGSPTAALSAIETPAQAPAVTPTLDEATICPSHESSEYVLPYPVGTEYTVMQSYGGRISHTGVFEFSVDFKMAIGTTVTAARGGRVVFIEESFSDDDVGIQNANLVAVLHEDGTYGRYVHLTHDGALVEVDQMVAQGDTIGLSGSSGYPPIPHLHFDVTEECPQSNCQTTPVCFRNTEPHLSGLEVNQSYTAESDN